MTKRKRDGVFLSPPPVGAEKEKDLISQLPPELRLYVVSHLNVSDAISLSMTSREWYWSVRENRQYWLQKARVFSLDTTCHITAKKHCVRVTMSLYKSRSAKHAKKLRSTVLSQVDQTLYYILSAFLQEYCSQIQVYSDQTRLSKPFRLRDGKFTIVAQAHVRQKRVAFVVGPDLIYYKDETQQEWSETRDAPVVGAFKNWVQNLA